MITYQEFLENCGIISEDLFTKIVDSLPDFEFPKTENYIDLCDLSHEDTTSEIIINQILETWGCVTDDCNFAEKTFYLYNVDELEDLEEIKNTFSKWTIENYDDLKEGLIEDANDTKFRKLIQQIRDKYQDNIDGLEKLVKTL